LIIRNADIRLLGTTFAGLFDLDHLEPSRLSLRHAILGVLEFQPLHGYALKCVLEEGISHVWPVNLAAIYPSLRKLEEEGLVTHETESTQSGRPDRKVYSVTEAGRTELSRWRRLPPDTSEYQMKNPLLLKLLFAKRENLPEVRSWLDDALAKSEITRKHARESLADADSLPFFVRFLRESGLEHLELQIDRLSRLREQVDAMLTRDVDREATGELELGIEV
jgi:DNA-binding PadR family transcriptional regulator